MSEYGLSEDPAAAGCAVVLAGGLGLRVRTVSEDQPKPMLVVAGRPFLEYVVCQLQAAGLRDLIFCVGYRAEVIQRYFGAGERWNVRIRYSVEEELRGTGGALKMSEALIAGENFVVLNGDSFADIDLRRLARWHEHKKALATIGLVRVNEPGRYGRVELDAKDNSVLRFAEKEAQPGGAFLINAGVYVFSRRVLDLIPAERPVSLETEVFPELVGKGFFGLAFDGYFVDIGLPDDYRRLQEDPTGIVSVTYSLGTPGGHQ